MKRFLLQNSDNKKWVAAQEKRAKTQQNVSEVAKLLRREMFPQLHLETIETRKQDHSTASSVSSISIAKELLIEANQRKLHCSLMAELVAY